MTEWVEIMGIAFGAQLAVLPGEKVQFIIAGLSTRFRPALVVGAAGLAFAGWTAVEILVGRALQMMLPTLVLDLITAGLFLLFGVLLYRSAPPADRDGAELDRVLDGVADWTRVEVLGWSPPDAIATALGIVLMMAAGEVGDKTQLVTIGLAAQYGASSAIWVGEMLAILPVSLANAHLFHRFAHKVNLRAAHLAAAGIFVFFGLDTILAVAAGTSVWEAGVRAVAGMITGGGAG